MGWSLLEKTIDPVCGKRINPVKAGIAAVHEGHSFYFCSRQCWASFQDAPSRYSKASSPAPKHWWGRLSATGGERQRTVSRHIVSDALETHKSTAER